MAVNWRPRTTRVSLPTSGALQDALNRMGKSYKGGNTGIIGASQFEAPKTSAYVQGGRAGVTGDFLAENIFPAPARWTEAPAKAPLMILSAIGEAINNAGISRGLTDPLIYNPIGTGIGITDNVVSGILTNSNRAARAFLNNSRAGVLRDSYGKSPDSIVVYGGKEYTVADFQRETHKMWELNEFTGERFTLQQLVAKARDDDNYGTLGFGEFTTDPNGIISFIKESIFDPINIAMIAATKGSSLASRLGSMAARGQAVESMIARGARGAGVRVLPNGGRLYRWNEEVINLGERSTVKQRLYVHPAFVPAVNITGSVLKANQIGRGALALARGSEWGQAISGGTSRATEYLINASNKGVGPASIKNFLQLAERIYFPGYRRLTAPRASQLTIEQLKAGVPHGLGMGKAKARLVSWQAGGMAWEYGPKGVEQLMSAFSDRKYDEITGDPIPDAEQSGLFYDIQDILHAYNNYQPLSSKQGLMMLALFSPWMSSINSAFKSSTGRWTMPKWQDYYNQTVVRLAEEFNNMGWELKTQQDLIEAIKQHPNMDEIAARLGVDKDAAAHAVIEYFIDFHDAMSVANQLSEGVHAVLAVEDAVRRSSMLDQYITEGVLNRRRTGALGPRRAVDFMLRVHRQGLSADEAERMLRDSRTITPKGVIHNMVTRFHGDIMVRDKLGYMDRLLLANGAPVSRQMIDDFIFMLRQLDPEQIIPREAAAMIIEQHPALMHAGEFWRSFAGTLGQIQEGTGKTFGRELLESEGVTVGSMIERLQAMRNDFYDAAEIWHESIKNFEKETPPIHEASAIVRTAPTEPLPKMLSSMRKRFVTAVQVIAENRDRIRTIRDAEFYKNGQPKYASMEQFSGYRGGRFVRVSETTFRKRTPEPHVLRELQPSPGLTGQHLRTRDPLNPLSDNLGPSRLMVTTDDVAIDLVDSDGIHSVLHVEEGYKATIAGEEILIVRPNDNTYLHPNRLRPRAKGFGDFDPLHVYPSNEGMNTNFMPGDDGKWYVLRANNNNGTLEFNKGFSTKEAAADAFYQTRDAQVTVKIDNDQVLEVNGSVNPPDHIVADPYSYIPDPVTGVTPAESIAANEAATLTSVRSQWASAGRQETPGAIIFEESPTVMPGYTRPDRTYYFIGDDGLPVGHLRISMHTGGLPSDFTIFVDPSARGLRTFGKSKERVRAADEMIHQALKDDIDIEPLIGDNVTPDGARHANHYITEHHDTLDSEALVAGIQYGGRLVEQPVIKTQRSVPTSDLIDWTLDLDDIDRQIAENEAAMISGGPTRDPNTMLPPREYYEIIGQVEPDETLADVHAIKNLKRSDGQPQDAYIIEVVRPEYIDPVSGYVHGGKSVFRVYTEEMDETGIPMHERTYNTYQRAYDSISVKTVTDENVAHAGTLARHGFVEVGRYGDDFTPLLDDGYVTYSTIKDGDNPNYLYRVAPYRRHSRVERHGIEPDTGLTRGSEPSGSYWGPEIGDSQGLAPISMSSNGVWYRVKRSDVTDMLHPEDHSVLVGVVSPDILEVFGTDGQWHVVSSRQKAVFAYVGGDTTKIAANARIKGATQAYQPSTRIFKDRRSAIAAAKRQANRASIMEPSLDSAGRGYTNSRRFFNPDARLQFLRELNRATQGPIKKAASQVQYIDKAASAISLLDDVTEINGWWEKATPREINNIVTLAKDANGMFPDLQLTETQVYIDPTAERFGHLVVGRNLMRRLSYDYGFLSPVSRFMEMMFAPVHSRALSLEVFHSLNQQLSILGFKKTQIERYLEGVRAEVNSSRSPRGLGNITGTHLFRNVRALPEGKLQAIAKEAFGQDGLDKIISQYKSVQKLNTESANSLMRRRIKRARHGGKVSELEAAVNEAFRHWQYDPVLEHVSDATHILTKTFYPIFRFASDITFQVMNAIEPYVYGVSRQGLKAIRDQDDLAFQHGKEINARAMHAASRHSIPPVGFAGADQLPIETLLTDSGMYTMPRNIKPILERDFHYERVNSTMDVLKALPKDDPLAVLLQERFGVMSGDNWVKGMDEVMFGWMNEGPEAFVKKQYLEFMDELGMSAADRAIIAPWMNRLSEMHRGIYNDLVDLYIGRLNRTGIERVLDNYWLMWPLSYQIKATKWLAEVMFHRIGGMHTGPVPAIIYQEYRERFNRMLSRDKEFANWLTDNRDFLYMLELMLPMSPESIGVSLNKTVRMAGSFLNTVSADSQIIRDLVGDYSYIDTVPEALESGTRFGPLRTYNMGKRLLDALGVPGFTHPAPIQEPTIDWQLPSNFTP